MARGEGGLAGLDHIYIFILQGARMAADVQEPRPDIGLVELHLELLTLSDVLELLKRRRT